jgi:hypothetical protein
MEESTMSIQFLKYSGASALVIAALVAGPMLVPAVAAESPCTAQTKSSEAPAPAPATGSSSAEQKTVPDGFGHQVVPGYGTTAPGTPSQLAAERKKGDDQVAAKDAKDAASDPSCK